MRGSDSERKKEMKVSAPSRFVDLKIYRPLDRSSQIKQVVVEKNIFLTIAECAAVPASHRRVTGITPLIWGRFRQVVEESPTCVGARVKTFSQNFLPK